MHMFPLGRVVYMPLQTSTATTAATTTTLLGPVTPDFSSPQPIPFYNTALLSSPFNLCTTTKCKFPFDLLRSIFIDLLNKTKPTKYFTVDAYRQIVFEYNNEY